MDHIQDLLCVCVCVHIASATNTFCGLVLIRVQRHIRVLLTGAMVTKL